MKKIEVFCVMMLISMSLFSQGLSKKEIRYQADSVNFSNLQQLIETKNFEFSATQVLPQSSQSIVLTTNEYGVIIKHDSIFCELPFYGRAYSATPGERGGLHFSEPITDYKMEMSQLKQKIEIAISAKSQNDNFKFYFTITGKENGSLSVNSNNRSGISYWGIINELKEKQQD